MNLDRATNRTYFRRRAAARVLTLISKIQELQELEQEHQIQGLPGLENMKQQLFDAYPALKSE